MDTSVLCQKTPNITYWTWGHGRRSKDELISEVLVGTPTNSGASVCWASMTCMIQLCAVSACCLEDMSRAMDGWSERIMGLWTICTTWWWCRWWYQMGWLSIQDRHQLPNDKYILHLFKKYSFEITAGKYFRGCSRGVMVKSIDCWHVLSKFVLQSRYYVHFRANTLGKGMNPLTLPAIG